MSAIGGGDKKFEENEKMVLEIFGRAGRLPTEKLRTAVPGAIYQYGTGHLSHYSSGTLQHQRTKKDMSNTHTHPRTGNYSKKCMCSSAIQIVSVLV